MDKITCNIIQDLLPLYVDGCCSPESRQAVEAHLKQCETCRNQLAEMRGEIPHPITEPEAVQKNLHKGMKKIRRFWLISLGAVAVMVIGLLWGMNYFRGQGASPANWDEQLIVEAFLRDLQSGDIDAAYQHINMQKVKEQWLEHHESFAQKDLSDIDQRGLDQFRESAQAIVNTGITNFKYQYVVRNHDHYYFTYVITVGGKEHPVNISVSSDGIWYITGGNGSIVSPDEVAQLCLFREYLWQSYAGCHYVPDQGYIYD